MCIDSFMCHCGAPVNNGLVPMTEWNSHISYCHKVNLPEYIHCRLGPVIQQLSKNSTTYVNFKMIIMPKYLRIC